MKEIKIKICGMKDPGNIAGIIPLRPDFIGFILYERSPRFVSLKKAADLVKGIPLSVRKTGVVVNEPLEHAVGIGATGIFDFLQLHGDETPDYCRRLSKYIKVIKAFHISKTLPENMADYQPFCSMFLFDTAGKNFGGTGEKFDHNILAGYNLNTDFLLSGGISVNDATHLKTFYHHKMAGVDLNSKFEVSAGIKNISMLKKFIENLRTNDDNN